MYNFTLEDCVKMHEEENIIFLIENGDIVGYMEDEDDKNV